MTELITVISSRSLILTFFEFRASSAARLFLASCQRSAKLVTRTRCLSLQAKTSQNSTLPKNNDSHVTKLESLRHVTSDSRKHYSFFFFVKQKKTRIAARITHWIESRRWVFCEIDSFFLFTFRAFPFSWFGRRSTWDRRDLEESERLPRSRLLLNNSRKRSSERKRFAKLRTKNAQQRIYKYE